MKRPSVGMITKDYDMRQNLIDGFFGGYRTDLAQIEIRDPVNIQP